MSLFYPPGERSSRGKPSEREDMVKVRFLELAPPRRIVEAGSFVTTDPDFLGEKTLTATFEEVSGGTEVTLMFENLPPRCLARRSSSVMTSSDEGRRSAAMKAAAN